MGIRRSTSKSAPGADEYTNYTPPVEDDDTDEEEDVYEDEDEDEVPVNAGIIQSGWGEAQKRLASASSSITTDFKVTGEKQLVKFLVDRPTTFMQHWLEQRQGKKSFICLGPKCPLCGVLGDKPSMKAGFQVVNLSSEEENVSVQWWIAGTRVFQQLLAYNADKRIGPLDRGYFSVSKTGTGNATVYAINPVKERDLEEEWDLDVAEVKKALAALSPLDESSLRPSSLQELREIARELS